MLALAGDGADHGRGLGIATLAAWLVTVGVGGYMLRSVITRDGFRRQRARPHGLHPGVLIGHFSLALTGLGVWIGYLATGWAALSWSAVGLLMPTIGLGISAVTLWTPYPGPPVATPAGRLAGSPPAGATTGMLTSPAEDLMARKLTDEVLVSALTDETLASKLIDEVVASTRADPVATRGKPRGHLAALVPPLHGLGAMVTFLLAVITAAGAA